MYPFTCAYDILSYLDMLIIIRDNYIAIGFYISFLRKYAIFWLERVRNQFARWLAKCP